MDNLLFLLRSSSTYEGIRFRIPFFLATENRLTLIPRKPHNTIERSLNSVGGSKMSRLLMNEFVIPVSIKLAEKIGLHEAMFLQQLHYWLQQSENVHEGYKWVYNTYEDWHKQLPLLSVNQIRRIVRELEKKKLIVTGDINRLKMDKTKWYRINYEAVEQVCESVNNKNVN